MPETNRGGVEPFEGMKMEYDAAAARKEKEAKRKKEREDQRAASNPDRKVSFFKEEKGDDIHDKLVDGYHEKVRKEVIATNWESYNAKTDRSRQKRDHRVEPISPRDIDGAMKAEEKYTDIFKDGLDQEVEE